MLLKVLGGICLVLSAVFFIGSIKIRNVDINHPYEKYFGLALSFGFLCAGVSLLGWVGSNANTNDQMILSYVCQKRFIAQYNI